MKSVMIIGYMGAGKTSAGKILAKRLGMEFYDLDWYIEERYRKKISEIFAEQGEEGFRQVERKMLHEVAEFENIVLALGGGTPCFFDNMDYLNQRGTTVFFDASPQTIVAHLKMSRSVRPLLRDKQGDELLQFVAEQMDKRRPFYSKAQLTVSVDILDKFSKMDVLVDRIVSMVEQQQSHTHNNNTNTTV